MVALPRDLDGGARQFCSCGAGGSPAAEPGAGSASDAEGRRSASASVESSDDLPPSAASPDIDSPAGAPRGASDSAPEGGYAAAADDITAPRFEERHLETDDGVLFLTAAGVLLDGGSGGAGVVRAAIGLDAVSGVRVERVRRGVRPWVWFAIGVAATAGTWQLLDGGGYVRMLFPGLVALATAAMLAFALWSPARYVVTLSGGGDARIAARVGGRGLEEAEDFADAAMAAAREARSRPRGGDAGG